MKRKSMENMLSYRNLFLQVVTCTQVSVGEEDGREETEGDLFPETINC